MYDQRLLFHGVCRYMKILQGLVNNCSDCSRRGNLDSTISLSRPIHALAFHFLNNILTGDNLSEDNVFSIQMGSSHKLGELVPYCQSLAIAETHCDEELGPIGVGSSISHGEQATLGMLDLEIFILKLLAIDGLAARALTIKGQQELWYAR